MENELKLPDEWPENFTYTDENGLTAEQAKKEVGMVVEGLNALEAAVALSRKYGVEMPIVDTVDALVKGKMDSREAVRMIMNRKRKDETD